MSRRWRRALAAGVDLYGGLLVLYLPLRLVGGDRLWPVALLGIFLHWALLPAFLFLPLAVRARRWITASLLASNVATSLLLFGDLFLPRASSPADGYILTVMTYNLGNRRVTSDAGSDHLPVLAELIWTAPLE